MKKILFVCLGNICRSPLGHGIMESIAEEHNFPLIVDSAGTSAYHVGEAPDKRSIQVAFDHHIDISSQKSRKVEIADFHKFDFILAMDRQNLANLYDMEPKHSPAQIHLLREFDPDKDSLDVPDPYYGGINGFINCYEMIDRSCRFFFSEKILEK